jgi:hypothetical protein
MRRVFPGRYGRSRDHCLVKLPLVDNKDKGIVPTLVLASSTISKTGPRRVVTKKEPTRKVIADEEVPFSLGTYEEGFARFLHLVLRDSINGKAWICSHGGNAGATAFPFAFRARASKRVPCCGCQPLGEEIRTG